MDRRQAREILSRHKPGDTLGDPQVGEALELARHDPQLAEWYAKFLAAQAENPHAVPKDGVPSREHIIPLNRAAFVMIALAAVFVAVILFWHRVEPKPQNTFNNYRKRMARLVQRSYPMESAATDLAQIREYIRANSGPADFILPRNLEKLPGKGCAVFPWRGHPVALMELDGGANTNLYLFLIYRGVFDHNPVPAKPEYVRIGRLLTASWTVGDEVYLLAGPDDPAALHGYVE